MKKLKQKYIVRVCTTSKTLELYFEPTQIIVISTLNENNNK
jgi:hypothetical protein